ncbi:hypothetical protein HK097_004575, partial [Rhizophlyctis rosea]
RIGVDAELYKRNGLIKCINQSKGDGHVQERISGSESLLDHTVLHNIPDDAIPIETRSLPIFSKMARKRKQEDQGGNKRRKKVHIAKAARLPKMNLNPPPDFDLYHATPLEKLDIMPIPKRGDNHMLAHSFCTKVARWCKEVRISFDQFWEWNKKKDDSDERRSKYEKYWKNCPRMKHNMMNRFLMWVYGKDILKWVTLR